MFKGVSPAALFSIMFSLTKEGREFAPLKYNPGLKDLMADERFQIIWHNKNEGGDLK